MSGEPMSIEAWRLEEFTKIRKFTEWYFREAKEDPEHFPLELAPGEWDQQYLAWEDEYK